jgi:cerevisin
MKSAIAASVLPLLAAASPVLIDTIHGESAPLISSTNAKEIPNSYIVVFKDHVTHTSASSHHDWVKSLHVEAQQKLELRKRSEFPYLDTVFEGLKHTYHIPGSFLGYSGHFDDDVIEQVRRHPDVCCSHCF